MLYRLFFVTLQTMDGSRITGGFESAMEDIAKSAVGGVKKTLTDTAKTATSGLTGYSASEPSLDNVETNTSKTTSQTPGGNATNPLTDPAKALADQQKIIKVRQELQQQHMRTYFNPTFHEKPAQIRQEREKKWEQSQQHEEQKKQQIEAIEEQKKQEFKPIALDLKAKGEIGKVGSG